MSNSEGLKDCCCPFLLDLDCRRPPVIKMYTAGDIFHSDISITPPSRKFYRGEKCEIWPHFLTLLATEPPGFRNGAR